MSPVTQLLQNAAAGTVLILVTALLRLALKKRLPPEVWLALWAICLFRLLTPIVPESPLSVYALPWRAVATAVTAPAVPAPGPSVTPAVPTPLPSPAPGGTVLLPGAAPTFPLPGGVSPAPAPAEPALDPGAVLWTALAAIWLLGAAVTALRLVLNWRRTRRAVGCATLLPPSDPRYAALPPGVRLREGPVEGAPLTFGAVRPAVVLPPNLSGAALVCVLVHEGVHARRRDNLWHYAVAVARTVFWWDPAVWLMERLLRRDIELSCDRAALDRLGPDRRREYAMTILDMSTQGEGAPFSRAFGQKQAEERIISIMKHKKMTALALALSVLLVCGVTAAFATEPVDDTDDPALTETEPVETEPADTVPVETEPVPDSSESPECGLLPSSIEIVTGDGVIVIDTSDPQIFLNEFTKAMSALCGTGMVVIPASSAAQSDCTHPNLEQGEPVLFTIFDKMTASGHTRMNYPGNKCPDCGGRCFKSVYGTRVWEAHTFGPASYVGANHTAADYTQHYLIFSKECVTCYYSYDYEIWAGCTQDGCVDVPVEERSEEPPQANGICYVLHIPTWQEVKQNGYPVNENGETYGPNVPDDDWDEIPDLQLAENQDGLVGYVRDSESPWHSSVRNPEEAIAYMDHRADWESHTDADHYVNMYLQDGVTVIGRFRIGGQCPCGL